MRIISPKLPQIERKRPLSSTFNIRKQLLSSEESISMTSSMEELRIARNRIFIVRIVASWMRQELFDICCTKLFATFSKHSSEKKLQVWSNKGLSLESIHGKTGRKGSGESLFDKDFRHNKHYLLSLSTKSTVVSLSLVD